jgi:hypothetical protein
MPRSWRRLTEALEESGEAVLEMSFDEISTTVGELPKSEMKQRGFWANAPDKAQAKGWLDAGYEVDNVDPDAEVVRFKRK